MHLFQTSSIPPQSHQLLEAFQSTFSESDKIKRQQAILYIKSQEYTQSFLENLFSLLSGYSSLNLTKQITQSVMNWIEKYIAQQYDPNSKHTVKHSRVDLLKIILSGFDKLTRIQNFPHQSLILLCKPVSMMVNHQFNQTLKLQLIEAFPENIEANISLVFYEIYSILLQKQSVVFLNRILAFFERLVAGINKAPLQKIPFYLEVIYMLLKELESTITKLSYQQIIQNQAFMKRLFDGVMTGQPQMAEIPLKILVFLSSLKQTLDVKNTLILNKINIQLFPIIYEYLSCSSDLSTEKTRAERKDNEALMVVMINYFTQILELAKDQEQFHSKKTDILLNIVFPLLLLPEDESKELMLEDPYKYLKIKEDIASYCQMNIVPCAAAKLLEKYCDKVDGISITAFNIAIEVIKNAISPMRNPIQHQYLDKVFFKSTSVDVRVETALLILCIISYAIQIRKECINVMEQIIEKHLIVLFNLEKPAISIMFLYLLCFYIQDFFVEQQKSYLRLYLVEAITVSSKLNPCKALLFEIYDFIESIITEGEYNMVVRDRTLVIGNMAITNVLDYDDVDALRLLQTLLIDQSSNITANYQKQFMDWVSELGMKLKYYIQNNQYNLFVIKGLSLLNSLMSNEEYDKYHDAIYKFFEPYMLTFSNPQKHLLFDEVLVIVNRYIQTKQFIPESVNILLDNIHQIIEFNDSNIYNIFRTMCFVVTYSKQPEQVRKVYELGYLTVKQTTTKLRSILNPLEGTLIVHLTLYHHIHNFNEEALQELIQIVMGILGYQYIKSHKVMYAKYLLIVLQCLNFKFEATTKILKQLGEDIYHKFYKLLFESNVYYDGYDRKLLVINLINLIYQKDFDGAYANIAMRTIIDVLYAQYNAVQLHIANNYEDSSKSQFDEKEEMQLTLSQNTKEIFKLYPNPYQDKDQYIIFKQLIDKVKMYESSAKILQEVANELPVGLKKFLTEYALRIKKVEGKNKKIQKRKIFKVDRQKYKMDQTRQNKQ